MAKSEEKATRTRRTKEEIIADLDKKIAAHQAQIDKLQTKKQAVLNPPKKRVTTKQKMTQIVDAAKKSGMTPEEIAEKLGIEI